MICLSPRSQFMNCLRGFVLFIALMSSFTVLAQPYVTSGNFWAAGAADVYIDFNITNPIATNAPNIVPAGPSNSEFNTAYVEAMNLWNTNSVFQYFPNLSGSPVDPCAIGYNGVKFDVVSCSGAFGSTTLAVQSTNFYTGSMHNIHTVTVFNNNKQWDIYSGPLQAAADFRRVAVHELGHGLGLDHSDMGNIMYSIVSSVELPQTGDIAGVTDVYGSGGGNDVDNDGVDNTLDNCPVDPNSLQVDADNDGYGDSCDLDVDGDGYVNDLDNCPVIANANQLDIDADLMGDVCDDDADGDGVFNAQTVDAAHEYAQGVVSGSQWAAGPTSGNSNFPFHAQTFIAANTGTLTRVQLPVYCPNGDATLQIRTVSGTQPTSTILSSDVFVGGAGVLPLSNQGFVKFNIALPALVNAGTRYAIVLESTGTCILFSASSGYSSGVGYLGTNSSFWSNIGDFRFQVWVDPVPTDNCPLTPNADQTDSNTNGIGDACEITDQDSDGIEDSADNCPAIANAGQEDFDLDLMGDACDTDDDNDNLPDVDEINIYGTNPLDADSDDDNLSDGDEVNTYQTNPLVADTDGDGGSDGEEVAIGTDPNVPDVTVPLLTPLASAFFAAILLLLGATGLSSRPARY